MKNSPPVDRLLKPSEVATRLNVPVKTVWAWLRLGQLKGERLPGGRLWRIRESALTEPVAEKGRRG